MRDRGDAIGFFYAQFLGMPNNRRAAGERARDSENRQFVNQLRHFFSLNDGPFQRRARDFDRSARLELIDVFDCFAQLRAHANEHAQQRRAGIIQTTVAHKQMTARLRGSGDQPESGR